MKIWRSEEVRCQRYLTRLEGRLGEVLSPAVMDRARSVVEAVRKRGDAALVSYVRRYDLKGLSVSDFRLHGEVGGAESVEEEFAAAIELAIKNLRVFHELEQQKGFTQAGENGDLGIRVHPLDAVGVYVPGGAAVYVSSLLMAVIPAQVAGVGRLAVATPPRAFLSSPHLRYVLDRLNLREVYLMGGAHAIAALAYGTESVTPVDKIVGPGGRFVAAAKRAVYGVVDVDGVAGPSEIVVVADGHAEADLVAGDVLAQAEHDPDALAVVLTTSRSLAEKVERRVRGALRALPRDAAARTALRRWGAIITVRDEAEALELVNRIAPEHVELLVDDPLRLVDRIERAGAVYVGPFSPAVLGDYVVGVNHVLPTAGAARFGSPLGVWDFVRRTAVVSVAPHRYRTLATAARTLALAEDLPLHAAALSRGSRGTA
ncbi:MAG: histidinol dehydrogenase [Thermoanaerobaculaceae bacterium]|nr:histidinol dehydrogenase [Thermoanaerobaculaceae bacterium]